MKQLDTIYLVDDDEGINFLNETILKRMGVAKQIVVHKDPTVAFDQLKDSLNAGNPPDLILLDINMPLMDGWEFIEKYSKLQQVDKSPIIIMLSSSIDPTDEYKARSMAQVSGFRSKPLTFGLAKEIIDLYFTN